MLSFSLAFEAIKAAIPVRKSTRSDSYSTLSNIVVSGSYLINEISWDRHVKINDLPEIQILTIWPSNKVYPQPIQNLAYENSPSNYSLNQTRLKSDKYK